MTISPAERARQPDSRSVFLQDGATLAVVGGGPAGAFFAILAARKARALEDVIWNQSLCRLKHLVEADPE
jgi:alkyl hydroperoxide reductase subunit AhpF